MSRFWFVSGEAALRQISYRTLAICLLLLSTGLGAQEVMQVAQNMPGFKAAMSYQDFGKGETVAPFNGGLTVAHACAIGLPENMGGSLKLMRVYSSKSIEDAYETGGFTDISENPHGILGLNWKLGFGRVLLRVTPYRYPDGSYVTRVLYFFEDESGAEHRLYAQDTVESWTGPNSFPAAPWYFTNDGSYIRAKYKADTNSWFIFFPDGSTRIAGGAAGSSYIAPVAGTPDPTSGMFTHLRNPVSHGWYVVSVADRAGNSISIEYNTYDAASQPYGGSIFKVTDHPDGRVITFFYNNDHLLDRIVYGTKIERYSYVPVSWTPPWSSTASSYNTLSSVADPEQLQTLYSYAQYTDPSGSTRPCLSGINYPTGAISSYTYGSYSYLIILFPKNPEQLQDIEVSGWAVATHSLMTRPVNGPDNTWNEAKWTWDHSIQPKAYLAGLTIPYLVRPVVLSDPLGTQEVRYFAEDDNRGQTPLPSGTEVFRVRRLPGASIFDPLYPNSGAATTVRQRWSAGDGFYGSPASYHGDAQHCMEDAAAGGTAQAPYGNLRVRATEEMEHLGLDLVRTTTHAGWDGFGHYVFTEVAGTPAAGYNRYSAATYDLQKELLADPAAVVYQLDRKQVEYAGDGTLSGTSAANMWSALPDGTDPPDPVCFSPYGQFKTVSTSFYPTTGLPSEQHNYQAFSGGFAICTGDLNLALPVAGVKDRLIDFAYDGHGNISTLTYKLNATGAPSYMFNFEWSFGMVSRSWRTYGTITDPGGLTTYPDDFNRVIDAYGRITSHTDPNNLVTGFAYDNLDRLTQITPPGADDPTQIQYPADSTSYGSTSWTTGHLIRFYVGTGTVPVLSPAGGTVCQPAGQSYALYYFDDLGRSWKANTLMPWDSGSCGQEVPAIWSERVTLYDALGQSTFTSEPYQTGDPLVTTGTAVPFPVSGTTFNLYPPMKNGVPFGTWNSFFGGAIQSKPFSGGSPEPLYRPLWTIRADGSAVANTYSGLVTTTVTAGIAAPGLSPALSLSTQYSRDVFGRLVSVIPSAGASAAYSYDSLGHLVQAGIGSQPARSFTYDALGHLLSANNIETGTLNYETAGYDALGNSLGYDQGAIEIRTSYDGLGRLTEADSGASVLAKWSYDPSGHGAAYPQLTHTWAYHYGTLTGTVEEDLNYDISHGRLSGKTLSIDLPATIGQRTFALNYTYNSQGQLQDQGSALETVASKTVHYTYAMGLLTGANFDDLAGVNGLSYWPSGALRGLGYLDLNAQARAQVQYGEDPLKARLSSITLMNTGGTQLWTSGAYSYDGAENIKAIGQNTFGYDALSRLRQAHVSHVTDPVAGTIATVQTDYTYDDYGNLLTRRIPDAAIPGMIQGDQDALRNEVNISLPCDTTTNRVSTYGYDSTTGNLLSDGKRTFVYDPLSQLRTATITATGNSESYFYDASGERVASVRSSNGTANEVVCYLRSGSQVQAEELFTLNGGAVSGQHAKFYLYVGGNLASTEEGEISVPPSTYSISGTVSGDTASGVTVTLTGAPVAPATTDSSGNYIFSGLANGSYTMTPSLAGYTFTPASTGVMISGANVTGQNFTAVRASATYSISGTVSGDIASGVKIGLAGPSAATATTDPSGNYTFSNLPNGTYTVTPSLHGYGFSPSSLVVPVSGANVTGKNFTARLLTISGWVKSVQGLANAGVVVTTQTGARGTTDSTGYYIISGLDPGTYTVTPNKASFLFTPNHAPVTLSSAPATLSFTSRAGLTYKISGTVYAGSAGLGGVTVGIDTGYSVATAFNGTYTLTGLPANSTFIVTPNLAGYTFTPANRSVAVSTSNLTGQNFTATAGYSISGTVSGDTASGVTVTLTGAPVAPATTDSSGNYIFSGLANGSYTMTPSKTGYTFTPASLSVTINGANLTGQLFTATAVPTYNISGRVTVGSTGAYPASVSTTGASTTTASDGSFTLTGLPSGTYVLKTTKSGYCFGDYPATVSGANVTGVAITGSASAFTVTGQVTSGGTGLSGVTISTVEAPGITTTTSSSGTYTLSGLTTAQTYTVTASMTGYTFSVSSGSNPVALTCSSQTAMVNFTGAMGAHSISGVVTVNALAGPVLQGVLVSATGSQPAAATTDANGVYTLSGLPNGTYTLSASIAGYDVSTMDPLSITLNGADKTGPHFIAAETTLPDYPALPIDPSPALDGRVALQVMYYYKVTVPSGTTNLTVTMTNLSADMDMYDQIGGLPTPAPGGYKQCVTTRGTGNETLVEPNPQPGVWFFAAYGYQPGTYKIRGTMTGGGGSTYSIQGQTVVSNTGLPLAGITVQAVSGGATYTATSDTSGNYSINGLVNGTYTVTPDPDGLTGRVWTPTQKTVTVFNGNATGVNFAGFLCTKCLAGVVMAPDGTGIAGVTIVAESQSAVTDANGVYVIDGLARGAHSVHPSAQDKQRYLFSPGNRTPSVTGTGPVRGVSFTATAKSGAASGPDEAAPEEPPAGLAENGLSPYVSSEAPTTMLAQARPASSMTEIRQRGGAMGPNARMEETEVYSAEGGNAAVDTGASARTETLGALTVRFYVWDHLGTTRIVLNSSGAIESRHDYEPYGVEIRPVYDSPNTHRYTGHERDLGTGLDYMHYRFYGSNMGRFMVPDNISGNMANPQSWNLYSYVHGNPVNFNDPTGHAAMTPGNSLQYAMGFGGGGGEDDGTTVYSLMQRDTLHVNLNVVIDQDLSEADQAAVKAKFIETQLADAKDVYGKAGIQLTASFSTGKVQGSSINVPKGALSVVLSREFAELASHGTAGGTKVEGKTGLIMLAMDRVSTHSFLHENTFSHELGHAFGYFGKVPSMPKDAALEMGMKIVGNFVTDNIINNRLESIRYLPFGGYLYGGPFYDAARQWGN